MDESVIPLVVVVGLSQVNVAWNLDPISLILAILKLVGFAGTVEIKRKRFIGVSLTSFQKVFFGEELHKCFT